MCTVCVVGGYACLDMCVSVGTCVLLHCVYMQVLVLHVCVNTLCPGLSVIFLPPSLAAPSYPPLQVPLPLAMPSLILPS